MDTGRDPRGELVRPFAITRGRTRPRRAIAIEAMLHTTEFGVAGASLPGDRHRRMIASLCVREALSLAELAAYTRLPLGVCRVLVADMVAGGVLEEYTAVEEVPATENVYLLERVLIGLRRL